MMQVAILKAIVFYLRKLTSHGSVCDVLSMFSRHKIIEY